MRLPSLILLLGTPLWIACGGSSSADVDASPNPTADAPTDPTLRYEPWVVGAQWSYKLTDPKGVLPPAMNKVTTIMPAQDVGGVHAGQQAYLVHIEQLKGSKDVFETISGELDIRYQTTFYDTNGGMTSVDVDQPYRLKLDESPAHVVANAQWSETFTETSTPAGGSPKTTTKTEQWRVVANDEQLTVIAGTFTSLHVQRTSSSGTLQDYWYVRGVGKIKETGGAQEEELMSYTIP